MMRILLLANSYPTRHSPSGASYITARIRALRAAGAQVTAVSLVPKYVGAVRLARALAGAHSNSGLLLDAGVDGQEYVAAIVPWKTLDVAAVRGGVWPERGIERAVRSVYDSGVLENEFDVVYAHGMYGLPAGEVARRIAAGLGTPLVVGMHGSDVTQVMPRISNRATETLRSADATVYVSEALRALAVGLGAPEQGSHVIPNGVDTSAFHPTESRAGRPEGGPRLLFVGNLLPVKGADRLPAILAAVRARYPRATLDVLGTGPLEDVLVGTEGVRMHGRVAPREVAAAMRRADVLLVPSRSEGWGCVVTESYACGTPVVATKVGGLAESVLYPEHLVGSSVDSDLPRMFAETVDEVLRHGPGPESLAAHAAHSDWSVVVRRELEVLSGVAG